ncbi:MAG: aminopeptidase P family protein, partial [Bacteroidaceae bacterium]|nr:aminopeptidase P family protein [Bacteroidaceae bacterium]
MNQELKNRKSNIRNLFDEYGIDAVLLTCNMSLLYVSGRIISGYIYLSRDADLMFVKRPNNINGQGLFNIRKPEQIPDILKDAGIPMPATLA